MSFRTFVLAVSLMALPLAPAAFAQTPVAIVEEISSKSPGLEFMDYLTAGQAFRLNADERLVIGYFKSCWRETIVGGSVTIGTEQSVVRDGKVDRIKVRCDSGHSATSKETLASGAMVFRNVKVQLQKQTVYALSPVFVSKGEGRLIIERIDRKEKTLNVEIGARQQGSFLDLSRKNVVLTAGGVYRAKHGRSEAVFKVDELADAEVSNMIGRLVRMKPPG